MASKLETICVDIASFLASQSYSQSITVQATPFVVREMEDSNAILVHVYPFRTQTVGHAERWGSDHTHDVVVQILRPVGATSAAAEGPELWAMISLTEEIANAIANQRGFGGCALQSVDAAPGRNPYSFETLTEHSLYQSVITVSLFHTRDHL